jgi:ribosome-associated translation inhibitor RaiA
MANGKWQGKVLLQGFEKAEIERIKKLMNKYDRRLGRLGYREIRLTLKRHKKGGVKGKSYLNEIKGLIKLEKNLLHAETVSHEFYPAIKRVMEKLEQEAEHAVRLENKRKGRINHIIDKT